MFRFLAGVVLGAIGSVAGLTMQVGPHDAATNMCNWSPFPAFCQGLLPSWFDQWAWLLPTSLLCVAGILLFWAPLQALFGIIAHRRRLIPLSEGAALIYGELRGTDLGRFTEGHTGSSDEILDNVGMQILHNAKVNVRRAPSPKWEIFPKSELSKMGVCGGATGIRYWGRDEIYYTDPTVSKRDVARVTKHLKRNANFRSEWSKAPPDSLPASPSPQPAPQPNISLSDAVEYIVGTSKWLGSGEGVVTAMADFIESLPQKAVLSDIQSWGRKGTIANAKSPLVPIVPSYWAEHVFDLAEFYRNGSGVSRHWSSSDHSPETDFNDIHFDRAQITKLPKAKIREAQPGLSPLSIAVGTDINFYELVRGRPQLYSFIKRFKIRVDNNDPARTISGIKVAITSVTPMDGGYRFPWVLSENGSINPGDHALVPLAVFEERRDPDLYQDRPYAADTFEVPAVSDRTLLLGIENEHTFQVRCTANDVPALDTRIKISFVAGRTQIEKV